MKKVLLIMLSALLFLGVTACTDQVVKEEKYVLPNLTGKDRGEAISILSALPIDYSFDDVVAFNTTEGLFVNYSDNLSAGSEVTKNQTITVYFAVHKNILPNLTGLTQQQAINELRKLKLSGIDIRYVETSDVEPGRFSHYADGLSAGMEVALQAEVAIFIAQEPVANHPVYISKYLDGTANNNGLEIYNSSLVDVDLSKYVLDFYMNGSTNYTNSLALEGILKAGETLVIAHPNASPELLELADITSNYLTFDGNDAIALSFKDHRIIDIVGMYGWGLTTIDNRGLVRKESLNVSSTTFSISNWNQYAPNYTGIFGTYPLAYPTTFTFDKSYTEIPYLEAPTGATRFKYVSNNDGDTARFLFYDTNEALDNSVRFVGVDTREMGSGDPMAEAARAYVYGVLSTAKEIYIQWDPTTGLRENYGRYLGLIWADGVLVNYQLVLRGYSQNNYADLQHSFVYEGVSLHQWFLNAETYAKTNRLGIWA